MTLWECQSCEFDCVLEDTTPAPYCPLCAGDNGVERLMKNMGEPLPQQRVEGVDMREVRR